MTLPNEHLPLPCSLRDRVLQKFSQAQQENGGDSLPTSVLIEHLQAGCERDETPLQSIRHRQVAAGQPGAPAAADAATIEWVVLAFDRWQRDFPVEAPLSDTLRRLLPLAAAVALREQRFFTPGDHPLHLLLDRLQHSAVGWQARLERAGQMLQQRIERAVERALQWFDDGSTDFEAIAAELAAAAERDEQRAARMVQRLEETEAAAVKSRRARREAARLVNEGLAACELPVAVGEFLKGPWHDSLQLVALRYGTESQEWREVNRITRQLMDSVQPRNVIDDQGHAALRRLSGELRHWLISLQHDADAADDAIGLVEYVHLRRSHGQDLGLTHIQPLPVPGEDAAAESEAGDPPQLSTGQWFLLEDNEGPLRAQLSLMLEDGRHLLFTNAVGLKAQALARDSFLAQLRDGRAQELHTEDSFSLSLAHAAGVDDENKLRALINPGYVTPVTDADATPEPELEPEPETPVSAPSSPEPAPAPRAAEQREPESLPSVELPSLELELAEDGSRDAAATTQASPIPEEREKPAAPRANRPAPPPELDVPMGAWLGFHDGETPIMAKLAVYDPRRDNYIFVNRRGIALRELSRRDLLALIDEGLVDILETRSYFRDEVERARAQRDD